MATVDSVSSDSFCDSFRLAASYVVKFMSNIQSESADRMCNIWSTFCERVSFDPLLTDY